jgi:hypothetical protein
MSKTPDRPFTLDHLVVPAPASGQGKAMPKVGHGAARQRREPFVVTTATQAQRLDGAKGVMTERVFRHLQFRWFRAYRKAFILPNDALLHAGISRHAQLRALASLVKLGLISMERSGPRKPPAITIL